MKKLDALKLSLLAASVAGLGIGCASSSYARYDQDRGMNAGMGANVGGVGASASAQVGSDANANVDMTTHRDMTTYGNRPYNSDYHNYSYRDYGYDEGSSRITVSALSFTPETRANWVNKFPFWDQNWKLRTIDTYTFAVPDRDLHVSSTSDLPQFSVNLPPGSVFVESAGGAGEVRTGRVIQHSPVPNR
jgi:hypothetical protein